MGKGIMVAKDASDLNFDIVVTSDKDPPSSSRSLSDPDSRSYEELQNTASKRVRARMSRQRCTWALPWTKAWHPFNNPVYKNSLFLRIGLKNKDNCLNSVISVGPDLSEICHFPILNDAALIFTTKSADGQYLALKPLIDWTDADIQLARSHRYKIEAVKVGGGVDRLEKQNTMHAFHCYGLKGVNTMAHFGGGDAFNERGMD